VDERLLTYLGAYQSRNELRFVKESYHKELADRGDITLRLR